MAQDDAVRRVCALGLRYSHCTSPMGQLSGGQRVRVHLLRASLAQPDLLLLDEPTNYIDTQSSEVVQSELERFTGCVVAGDPRPLLRRDLRDARRHARRAPRRTHEGLGDDDRGARALVQPLTGGRCALNGQTTPDATPKTPKAPHTQGLQRERMMGLEPTTFAMARRRPTPPENAEGPACAGPSERADDGARTHDPRHGQKTPDATRKRQRPRLRRAFRESG